MTAFSICPRCQCQVFELSDGLCRFCAKLKPDHNLAAVNRMLKATRLAIRRRTALEQEHLLPKIVRHSTLIDRL